MTPYMLLTVTVFALALGLRLVPRTVSWHPLARPLFWAFGGLALLMSAGASFTVISQHSVGHLKRVYFAADMKPGQIIASLDEQGPQARILGPGFHVIPLVNLLYEVEELPLVMIPDGSYGHLMAKDGEALADGQYMAHQWHDEEFDRMLEADYFLANGGQKGPQLSVLKPGVYRLNRYLFDVRVRDALNINAGEVAVIKSNVQEAENCPDSGSLMDMVGAQGSALSLPVVPVGCVGVWDEPLLPGRYYLNREAYMPTLISTRAQTWIYSGGYDKRLVDLTVDDAGNIHQQERTKSIVQPKNAADKAVIVMIEGWRVPLDVWVVMQVDPNNAPRVVASVGGIQEVEDRIVTPALRSIVRNVAGAPERQVLDLIDNRETLESLVEQALFEEGQKAGVTIKEVRFGDPVIPAALLVARQRQQLADQLDHTYERERIAQQKRIALEKSRATANQQTELVHAQIAVQIAEQEREQARLQGEGEKLRLTEISKGQRAQTDVLGRDSVVELAILGKVLDAAVQNPDIVKVPSVYVQGEGQGFEGPAAILGASNLLQTVAGD